MSFKEILANELLGRGTTAEVYALPGNQALKAFPFRERMPSTLADTNRLPELLGTLQAAGVRLIPETKVVEIEQAGYFPQAIKMRNVAREITDLVQPIREINQQVCLDLSETIAKLHSQGIVIDRFVKGIISSHAAYQIYVIFVQVSNELTVFDWTNLALVKWFPSSNPNKLWVEEVEKDLLGPNDYRVLFSGGARRPFLEHYQKIFQQFCPNSEVKERHQQMIKSNLVIRL